MSSQEIVAKQNYEAWTEEMTLEGFVTNLRLINLGFTWGDFLRDLKPTGNQGSELRDLLLELGGAPPIFWFPGSGIDLKPAILDAQVPLFSKHLLTKKAEPGCPLLLMNDYNVFLDPFLDSDNRSALRERPYYTWEQHPNLFEVIESENELSWLNVKYRWRPSSQGVEPDNYLLAADLKLGKQVEHYLHNEVIPISILTLDVKERAIREQQIKDWSKQYLLMFSSAPSHQLFQELIFPIKAHISAVLLAEQGGFSQQIRGFEQYRDVPNLLGMTEEELGQVETFILDAQAFDRHTGEALSSYLGSYEKQDTRLPFGWKPCRYYVSRTYQNESGGLWSV